MAARMLRARVYAASSSCGGCSSAGGGDGVSEGAAAGSTATSAPNTGGGGGSKCGRPPAGGGISGCSAQPGPPPAQRAARGRLPFAGSGGCACATTVRLSRSAAITATVTTARWRSASRMMRPIAPKYSTRARRAATAICTETVIIARRRDGRLAPTEAGVRPVALDLTAINERVREQARFVASVREEVAKVIVGQDRLVERLLIGLLCRGHILIEGVPGLAKTLTVSTLARALDASFVRVQFTPDLLPADLTGTTIYSPQDAGFHVRKGPIFANIVLADEINRAPAKVQSALLEAMQERQVSIGGQTFPLGDPFMVLATQNPIEHEGTYPLPEAQLDRFMLKVDVPYPTRDVHMDQRLRDYIVHVVYATREPGAYRMPQLAPLIEYGASPRATIYLA